MRGSRSQPRSARLGPFRGRVAEIAQLRAALQRDSPIITVTGLPGVGKSRLVAEAVGPNAVWFDAGAGCAADDIDAIPGQSGLVASLQDTPIGEPVVAVLDGLDGLDAAGNAERLAEIVDLHPLLRIVVTTRTRLNIRGEQTIRVLPWQIPDTLEALLAEGSTAPAVQCFIDHACRAAPTFDLTIDNAQAVLDLLHTTGGLPLAVELTAAWLRCMTVDDLAGRATQSILAGGPRDVPASQRDLVTTFDLVLAQLTPDARSIAETVARFPGPVELTTVERVAATHVSFDVLGELVDANLVAVESTAGTTTTLSMPRVLAAHLRDRTTDVGVAARFATWLYELVREHGERVWTSQSIEACRALQPHVDRLPPFDQLVPGEPETAVELTLGLCSYWGVTGQFRERLRRLDAASRWLPAEHPLAPWIQLELARALRDNGRYADALAITRPLFESPQVDAHPVVTLSAGLQIVATQRVTRTPFSDALIGAIETVAATSDADSVRWHSHRWVGDAATCTEFARGDLALQSEQWTDAIARYRAALASARQREDVENEVWALYDLCLVLRSIGDLDAVEHAHVELVTAAGRVAGTVHLAYSLVSQSVFLAGTGRRADAHRAALRAHELIETGARPFDVAQNARMLALALAECGDHERSRRLFTRALRLCELLGDPGESSQLLVAFALAAPPVGPDTDTRSALVRAACRHGATALMGIWGPWQARADILDLDSPDAMELTEAIAIVATVIAERTGSSVAIRGGLSPREAHVLGMIAEGLTDRQIAEKLTLGLRTVQTHTATILRKLGVANRREAAAWAAKHAIPRSDPAGAFDSRTPT